MLCSLHVQVFAIGAATVMAQRPSLGADSLQGSGIISLSRVSKFRGGPDGSPASNVARGSAPPGAAPAQRDMVAGNGGSPAALVPLGRIEVAAEHAAAAAAAEAAGTDAARESSPTVDAQLDARQAAAAMEPPEWFIRCSCSCRRKRHGARWWLHAQALPEHTLSCF
jgi:hypothetical protein